RGSAVRQVSWLAAAVAIHNFVNSITSSGDFPELSNAVLNFPVIVIAAWSLYLLAGCVVQSEAAQLPAAEQPFRVSALRVLARGIRVIAVLAPVIAAIGYSTASVSFVFPLVQTLAILGGLLVSQWLFSGLVDLSFRDPGASHKMTAGLVNTLVGFALFCMALPMIALLWGARVADLTEIWTLIQSGIQIGNRQLTPTNFLTFAIVFSIGYTLTRLLQGALRSSVLPNTQLDSGGRNAVLTGVGYLGILIAAISAITAAGIDLSGLAIVAGALSVGIGFGLQAIVGNFVSGIILLIERPIKQGDWVEVGSYSGYVKSINVRSTQIETFDRATVIVPNADLIAGTVTNYTHGDDVGRLILGVGVAYGTDPRRVEAILLELARAHPRIQQIPGPGVVFRNFGADSLDFEIRAILKDVNYVMSVRSELNFQICEKFAQEGIEMPFAQRDIHLKDIDKLASAISGIPEKK
ncbi:MAG: potassium efflux system protein, partial [Granulosicoccus sp.]